MDKSSTLQGAVTPVLFEHMPVAVICVDSACMVTFVNDAALTGLNTTREAILGSSFLKLIDEAPGYGLAADCLRNSLPLRNQELKIKLRTESAWIAIDSFPVAAGENPAATFLFLRNITTQKKKENLAFYLNQATAVLVKTRVTDVAMTRIAEFIVPSFADWFTVDILRDGRLELLLLRHVDPGKVRWARKYRKAYPPDAHENSSAAQVIKTGQPVFIPFLTEEMIDMGIQDPVQRSEVKKIGLHSMIMAPMASNGEVTGMVTFISSDAGRHYDEQDVDFALNFANLINLSLENTRLHEAAQQDIEQRKQTAERFRFLLDAIPHKLWTSGPDGRATYYNKQWHIYTGISGFDDLREQVWGIIHPEDLQDAAQKWPQAVKSGEDMETEHRFRRHDGEYRWHLSRVSAIKDADGQVLFWIGTSTDIHEQKAYELELAGANEEMEAGNEELLAANEELQRAQKKLQTAIRDLEDSKMRFQLLLDSIPQIAWSGAPNGEVTYYNRRWYEYTGLTFGETSDWGWKQVIHPDDIADTMERLSAIITSQRSGEFELRERDRNGVYRWHLVRTTPVFDSGNKLVQWVGTATDIDDLKKLQQQKDDFISIASHELKTPLTTIKASIQLLYSIRDELAPERSRKLVEQAYRSTYKMTSLVDDLLNKNRFQDVQTAPQKKWFILSELVNGCCNPVAVSGQHEFLISGDKSLEVHADEHAIDQVVVNFINNAVKYAPDSREIRINIERMGSGARLSVSDNGPGIPKEQLPLVFNRYYQGGKQHYRSPGLGLGLYISAEIIKKHGGTIDADSEPGKGSTFWFTLPEAR